jgi:hypothetical protein
MEMRWRIILPVVGLLLFGVITHHAFQWNSAMHGSARYFWWSAMRLDKEPLNRNPSWKSWETGAIWIEPGVLPMVLVVSSLPAFAVGKGLVRSLGLLGVSELTTFLTAMPVLIATWYFLVDWLLDWWRLRRATHRLAA